MIRRATPQRQLDERRFRFRVRFERPPGGGIWRMEYDIHTWLIERLGRGNFGWHPDIWEGHGTETYALHLDDHTVIPELLKHYATIVTTVYRAPTFVAKISRDHAHAVRTALVAVQSVLVDRLNSHSPRVSWAMGRCAFLPGETETVGDAMAIDRINRLTEVATLLSVGSADDAREVRLGDYQRGAVEVALSMYGDWKPVGPDEHTPMLREFLNSLIEER